MVVKKQIKDYDSKRKEEDWCTTLRKVFTQGQNWVNVVQVLVDYLEEDNFKIV